MENNLKVEENNDNNNTNHQNDALDAFLHLPGCVPLSVQECLLEECLRRKEKYTSKNKKVQSLNISQVIINIFNLIHQYFCKIII